MQATTSGAIDQNMSRPSCSSRGLAGLAVGSGCEVTARVSQLPIGNPALGQSGNMTACSRRDGPECDFAVDPIDGTTLMSKGMPNAISVLAVADRGSMFDPSAVFYMNKIAVGPDAAHVLDITAPIGDNIRPVAKVKGLSVRDMTVCILDRPRHAQLIQDVRDTGARIRLITDGDVRGAISTCRPGSGTDMLAGMRGTPWRIIAAA